MMGASMSPSQMLNTMSTGAAIEKGREELRSPQQAASAQIVPPPLSGLQALNQMAAIPAAGSAIPATPSATAGGQKRPTLGPVAGTSFFSAATMDQNKSLLGS